MDFLSLSSLSATLLSVLSLVQKLAKLISATARLQDPNLDQIYHRLLAERKRTEKWASHTRAPNSTNLRATVPFAEHEVVVVHFGKMDTCYKKAHERLSAIEDVRKGPVGPAALKTGTKSLPHGYDDLKEFVDTLVAMNNTSKSSAPPLPVCSPLMTMDDASLAAKPSSSSDATAHNVDKAAGMYEPTTTQSIQGIYQATLDTLVTLSVKRRDPQIARSASRLQLWGAGLFKMSIPLDVVFESDKDGCQLIRNCISKALVEILVWEELEFNLLASEADNKERARDQHTAQVTTALLGSDELIDFALESWRNLLERQADNRTNPSASKTDGDLIPDLIQILFDLLPALRAARQTHCIQLAESSAHQDTIAGGQADASTAPPNAIPRNDDLEGKLDAVGETLSKRDEVGAKKGRVVKLKSRIFRRWRDI